jgi:hypothetical protein
MIYIYVSIGSLGAGKSKEFVSGVTVNGAKITGTKNGVRIKTWPVISKFILIPYFIAYCIIYKHLDFLNPNLCENS